MVRLAEPVLSECERQLMRSDEVVGSLPPDATKAVSVV